MFSQSEHNTLFTLCFQLSLCYTTLVSKGCAAFILTLISESHTHPLFKWYLTSRHFLLEISWDYGRDGASQMAPVVKNPLANAGDIKDTDLIPGLEKSPGGGHGNPLQYSCLENPMDRGAGGLQPMGLQRVRRKGATKHEQGQRTLGQLLRQMRLLSAPLIASDRTPTQSEWNKENNLLPFITPGG